MRLARVLAIGAAPVLLACAVTADILRLDPTPRPATSPGAIQLIAQEPQRPYTVIAIVSAHGWQPSGHLRAKLQKEAARLGGHAVLFDTSSLTRVGSDPTEQQLTGKVIVFTDSAGAN